MSTSPLISSTVNPELSAIDTIVNEVLGDNNVNNIYVVNTITEGIIIILIACIYLFI